MTVNETLAHATTYTLTAPIIILEFPGPQNDTKSTSVRRNTKSVLWHIEHSNRLGISQQIIFQRSYNW